MQMKPVARIKKRQSEKQDPFLVFINEARAWLKVEWPKVAAGVVALMLAGSFFVDRFTGVDKTDWRGTADIVSAYQQAAFGDPKGAIKEMDRIRTEYDGIAERLAILGKGDLMMLTSDMTLLKDPEFGKWVRIYAKIRSGLPMRKSEEYIK